MRLWSLHPKMLDPKGLVALWREALLARKVLEGKTKGYKNHPQLERFKNCSSSLVAINNYLYYIYKEGKKRGYKFNEKKILPNLRNKIKIKISDGQLNYEIKHLLKKLYSRDKKHYFQLIEILKKEKTIKANPIFKVYRGEKEKWEK
ncbi:MAG: pyrimidine dimer DNA glycosylase/endonuclease V [Leptospiraceae bacterium]|nr:pyrimidine dimer DNA glycosylase/endonuclease V [Leptospiraceae bacterium]